MKLSIALDYSGDPKDAALRAGRLEGAGVDMIWVSEPYGFDAVSILGFLAAHTERVELAAGVLPIYSRTPALTAMTAAGLDAVSSGRFVLGLGTSGPQVIEGWHGVRYDRPMLRTSEVIDICRMVWAREPLAYDGLAYKVPLPREEGTVDTKPLKMIHPPLRSVIPIYLAALGPKNVQLAAARADGWFPAFFYPEGAEVWAEDLAIGGAERDPAAAPLEVVAGGTLSICDEATAQRLRDAERPRIALYVGGMGPRENNFYAKVFRRLGFEREAELIQDHFLAGRRAEAEAAVPEAFLRASVMAGDESFVRDRIQAFRDVGVTRLNVTPVGDDHFALLQRVRPWI